MRFDPLQPFLRSEALGAGVTPHELRGPRYRRLAWNVYISSVVPDSPALLPRAALLIHPRGAVISHVSAAKVLGAPVPNDARVHVTVGRANDRRHRRGMRCHVLTVAEEDVVTLRGVRMSSPHRIFVELASTLSLVDLVVVGDWMVRRGHVTPESLVAYCKRTPAQHAGHARRAASYVRERVDSPMETRVRMLLVLAGLPEPEVNQVVRLEGGGVLLRFDLLYRKARLGVEYDGRQHVDVIDNWEDDVERRDLVPDDWRLLTVTRKGVYVEPAKTLDRVWRALKSRGYPSLKPPTDEWRAHFGA